MTQESATSVLQRMDLVMGAVQQKRRQTLTEICAQTGLPRTTVHRFLENLVDMRWLSRVGNQYELGVRMLEMAAGSPQDHWFHALAHPSLLELQSRTRLTVHLTFLDDTDVLVWNKLPGMASAAVPTRLGARLPAHQTASGKAIVAAAEPDVLEQLLAQPLTAATPRTITDRAHLRASIEHIRERGLARDDGETAIGIGCLAGAVVAMPGGRTTIGTPMIAGISVSGPRQLVLTSRPIEVALRQACRRIQLAAAAQGHRAYAG